MAAAVPQTKILFCGCLAAGIIKVQVGRAGEEFKPRVEVPWMNRQNAVLYQDQKYGSGMRVHNREVKKAVNGIGVKEERGFRCTVCSKHHE